MRYASTKTYGHEVGLSCCFRQWRANSHCAFLHGYALSVRLEFEADRLDERNWVIDFGGLSAVKSMLTDLFDHTLVVAADDPQIELFKQLDSLEIAQLVVLPAVGCEAFAKHVYDVVNQWLARIMRAQGTARVKLSSVEIREHGANSAIYRS